ncbi:condensation domain-containing protein [Nocardia seriolae]|uniref:Diacylglycerol O-acyltransferase n=1 Tax=Nocardia seriolae TaxID=37332 RepID=A0ABC9YKB7_9NOCA|nr:hypothetical protein [Nocardia seriolae]APA95555.1 hypothetical protein NS506_01484 [Nocardia seriolae]OJF78208.1 hypothetical protein NS14008_02000 [Nocardia seriolae]QOW31573.1 hypothetical protein IMZ23_26330 [Nocardia seriolae]WNJ58616.1 hypothetical protein RMO66_35550 [Nocardia seriolae]BEK99134.1 hypothetical protein NSER024013_70400 [Nocardia seriolae]
MNRLSVLDEIFLRSHRGLGTPIVLQGLWRTAEPVHPALLWRVHRDLRTGPLGRRVVRSRVPGARPRWQPNESAHPFTMGPDPIPVAAVLDWADRQGAELNPETGPGWRLSAARLDDGGRVVALTCSHALADGRALTLAIDNALSGTPLAAPPAGHSDWADARRMWATVLGGTARALRHGIPERPSSPPDRKAPPTDRKSLPGGTITGGAAVTSGAILEIPARDWNRVAVSHGGTANSLFVHLVANMLWASGFPSDTIAASLPVDTRDEPRVDNDMSMTEVAITRDDTPATLRRKARAAYEHRMTSPGGIPEEILQVVPDRWAYRLAKGAGERDILCSNIGNLPESLLALGPHGCTGLAARAIHPGLRPDALPRTRLSGYLTRIADTYTLSLVSLDPRAIPTPAALSALARTALAEHGLRGTAW